MWFVLLLNGCFGKCTVALKYFAYNDDSDEYGFVRIFFHKLIDFCWFDYYYYSWETGKAASKETCPLNSLLKDKPVWRVTLLVLVNLLKVFWIAPVSQ